MESLDLESEAFPPTGAIAAEGARKALGRPALDPLAVLVRAAVQNSWAATSDNGLAAIAYAPSTVIAKVGGRTGANAATATIVQETTYPFGEDVRFKLTVSTPTSFPLALRTPAWCEGATITINGQPAPPAKPGAFAKLDREWKSGDEVVLKLPMSVRIRRGIHQSVSVHRGPLEFAGTLESHGGAMLRFGFEDCMGAPEAHVWYASWTQDEREFRAAESGWRNALERAFA